MPGRPVGKASCWSITINNPDEEDHQRWEALKTLPWVKRAVGQLEQGESGTPHIQGFVETEYGRFFVKLQKALLRAHIEPAKNRHALELYVKKADTRIGAVAEYERPATRIATQQDVQNHLVTMVRTIAPSKYPERWEASENDLQVFMSHHGWIVRQDADWWIDTTVRSMIQCGYFGVEFTMANNQIRGAFKRYIDSIIIRNISASNTLI